MKIAVESRGWRFDIFFWQGKEATGLGKRVIPRTCDEDCFVYKLT